MPGNRRLYCFRPDNRLTEASDFRQVFAKPTRFGDRAYTVLVVPTNRRYPRLGVIASKKNVRKSVDRSRIKRIVRESFRLNQQTIGSHDVVVICKRPVNQLDRHKLAANLEKHWNSISRM